MMIAGCESEPRLPEDDALRGLPQVRNVRPDFASDKAVLHVQAETTFLRADADLSKAWELVTTRGLSEQAVQLFAKNGIIVGTMTAAQVSEFYTRLPRTGGTKTQTIGVGHEPVIFETTPTLERAVEIEALLGVDRDETVLLPAGRTQLLLDVVIDGEQVTMGVTPHHHWVSPSVLPRSPAEKAMEGRAFKELAFDVDLTGDRFLVLGWLKPTEPAKPVKPANPAPDATPPPATEDGDAPADGQAPAPAVEPAPVPVRKPKLGDLLFTGQRADRPLQLVCIIRVPPQGEMFGDQLARPER